MARIRHSGRLRYERQSTPPVVWQRDRILRRNLVDSRFNDEGSTMTTSSTNTALHSVGGLSVVAGALFLAAGAGAWFIVTKQLRDEKITVPDNAPMLAGKPVHGPVTAYVEALVIKGNAERGAGGRTFADISEALRGVDGSSEEAQELRKQSAALSTAASLRTSLMTSVLAYGVSAFAAGLGAFFVVSGSRLCRAGRDAGRDL